MISKYLSPLRILLIPVILTLGTVIFSIPIFLAGIIKLLLPFPVVWHRILTFSDFMMWGWCQCLALAMQLNLNLRWDVEGIEGLSKKNWYLMIANHQSWCDIIILCVLFRNRIPMNKYFLKYQLIWVPFVGLACWALDMPFMRRYAKKKLIKHPHLRGKDIATTKKSCEKFRLRPTTIVNFIEGTRLTEQKLNNSDAPYQHLLQPKAASIAFTLSALGNQFDRILNVTLIYPDNRVSPFLDLLCGRLKHIIVRVETLPVTESIRGDYFNDKEFKRDFQNWLNSVWQNKDLLMESLIKKR